ncbi:MAG: hypothetical protein FWG87_05640 [Defluviitaleaceae bacterium]|nr:hypothetical protein [Defluviitaleaceae bacterium]
MISLPLFTSQLEQVLAKGDKLESVCDLLRTHTAASVTIRGKDGRILAECLADGGDCVLAVGCLTLRRQAAFTDDEKLAASIALCVCVVLLRHREGLILAEQKRRASAVRTIINSLSFSELETVTHVLKEFEKKDETEGLLVAGHVADKLGYTRSVVTGAFRKLEAANLIETRSLGMKGTYVKIKEVLLVEEFGKL